MGNFDVKYYWAVFLRRLPYFLVIATILTAVAVTLAFILPPSYRSQASMLVEPQQIPGDLAETTVPIDPYEQIQIIEQRMMTRANLIELAERIGLYDDQPDVAVAEMVGDIRDRIEFLGFEPDVTKQRGVPGATIIGVAFWGPTGGMANKGANELVSLILEENVRLRTGRAGDTRAFFETEVERLAGELDRQAERISEFKTENVEALPDSLATRRAQQQRDQERLLALERDESSLKNQRDTLVWLYQRTGRGELAMTPEQETLTQLKSELVQQRAIYAPTSPTVRVLENRIAALEALVEEQNPTDGPDGTQPMSELEVELAPIEAQLEFIAQEKELIETTLAEVDESIKATPANEMVLAGMERDLEALQRQHDEALANRSQAAVGERIEVLSKGERFSLIEPPTMPGKPARPRRLLISAAGVVGGFGAGLGFIVLMELLNRSIRRPVELSSQLGIQPFATIPYMRTAGERRWKGSVMVLVLVLIAVAIPAGLFALHTYYMPLDLMFDGWLGEPPLPGEGIAPEVSPEVSPEASPGTAPGAAPEAQPAEPAETVPG
jgi:polysaccharide biosynthesis transport protein